MSLYQSMPEKEMLFSTFEAIFLRKRLSNFGPQRSKLETRLASYLAVKNVVLAQQRNHLPGEGFSGRGPSGKCLF